MIKRFFTFFLVVVLAICPSLIYPQARAERSIVIPLLSDMWDVAFSSESPRIFGINHSGLNIFEEDGSLYRNIPCAEGEEYGRIGAHGKDLWATLIGEQAADHFDLNGNLIERKHINIDGIYAISSIRSFENFLVLHGFGKTSNDRCIWIYNVDDETYAMIPEKYVICYDVTPSGLIYAVTTEGAGNFDSDTLAQVKVYDMNGRRIRSADFPLGVPYAILALDENQCYVVTDSTLSLWNMDESSETQLVYSFPRHEATKGSMMRFNEEGHLKIWLMELPSYVYDIPMGNKSTPRTLTFYGTYYYWELIEAFEKSHPEVRINVIDEDEVAFDSIITEMLSGSGSVDIFSLGSIEFGSRGVVNNGYYVDLYGSSVISEDAAKWYPIVRESSTHNGKLFGYPMSLFGMVIAFTDIAAYDAYGKDVRGMDWFEYIDLLRRLKEEGKNPFVARDTWLIGELIDQCIMKLKRSPAEEHRIILGDLLRIVDALKEGGFIAPESDERALMSLWYSYYGTEYDNFVQLPSFPGEEGGTNYNAWWLCINPYSENKEIALEFIEQYVHEKENGFAPMHYQADQYFQYNVPSSQFLRSSSDVYESGTVLWQYSTDNAFYDIVYQEYYLENTDFEETISKLEGRLRILLSE